MKKRIQIAFIPLLLLAWTVKAQNLQPPTLAPSPSTENQQRLIKAGVELHDQGDYDGAVNRYTEVLKENPNNVLALYEASYSYWAKKNYQKCIEVASKAAKYKSELLELAYIQLGTCFDDSGDSQHAIENYKFGIQLVPSSSLLHYNLAITYHRVEQLADAKMAVKKAVVLNPNHPGSQLLLSRVFSQGSYKIPSLLAALRFLILEANSQRSAVALQLVKKQLRSGVSPGKDGNNINIFLDTGQKKDEGDFQSVDLFMSLMQAANFTEKNKNKTEIQLLVENLNSLCSVLSESSRKADRSEFTWKYYVPYFIELKQQGHTEAFVYYINQQSSIAEVNDWLEHNKNKVANFLTWSRDYRWPKVD